MKRRNGVVAADFSNFGKNNFPFKTFFQKCFKIVVFPLWCRDPVLELQIVAICGADVRNSIVFRNSVSADRSGVIVSSILRCGSCMCNTIVFFS